jgi:hypothetical protein
MKKPALIIISTFLILLGAVAIVGRVQAQQTLPLTVIPPKQEVLINPGEHLATSVKFLNQGDSPVTGTISVLDFIVTDDSGTPVFLDNPQVVGTTTIAAKYSAAKWITIPQNEVTIAAKGNVAVPIAIDVPKVAAAGGRYAAVLFQPAGSLTLGNPASAQEIPVVVRLASLIYIRVAGAITESASLIKFQAPSFLEYGPISITSQILNQGNYHITPVGAITLKNIFGQVVAKKDLDPKNIFPGTSRTYTSQLGPRLMIGKFTATLTAAYGDEGKVLTSTLNIVVFPWKVALAILLALIIIALSGTVWYKKFRKKEEKLVEELKEEKTELESLKEELKDKITAQTPQAPKEPTPPEQKTS